MTDDALSIQTRLLQGMSTEQKLRIAAQLRDAAWAFKAVGIRMAHPELADGDVQERVRQVFLNARS